MKIKKIILLKWSQYNLIVDSILCNYNEEFFDIVTCFLTKINGITNAVTVDANISSGASIDNFIVQISANSQFKATRSRLQSFHGSKYIKLDICQLFSGKVQSFYDILIC